MREAQLRLLSALHEATRLNAIRWALVNDDDQDIYRAAVGETCIQVEYVYVPVTGGECADRFVACFNGLGVGFEAAIGTEAYEAISAMLSLQVFGWSEGRAGSLKALTRATARVEALISSLPQKPASQGTDHPPGA